MSTRRLLRRFVFTTAALPREAGAHEYIILLLPQCGIDLRHDLLGHQLHRTPREPRIDPIVARIVERTERADLLAEREDLVDYAVHCPRDHQARRHRVGSDRRVRLALVELEQVAAPSEAHELTDQLLEI